MACRVESVGLRPLLREDLELADAVPGPSRAAAAPRVLAEVVELERRSSAPDLAAACRAPALGVLLLEGLLLRRVEVMAKLSYELLGPGDVIPSQPGEVELVPHDVSWRALDDVRLALLDDAFVARAAPWPHVLEALAARGMRRASAVSLERALTQHRVELRIDLVLWHLAGRWGKVVGEGLIRLPLPLTHEIVAHLAGCSRPAASWALGHLAELRLVQREKRGWLLQGSLNHHLVRLDGAANGGMRHPPGPCAPSRSPS